MTQAEMPTTVSPSTGPGRDPTSSDRRAEGWLTTATLARAADLAAMVAGLLFIVIQFVHPAENLGAVSSSGWAVTGAMTMTFAILALVGVSGVYLRQVREAGVLGLVGYLLLAGMFLLTAAVSFTEVFVLPLLVDTAPQFVDGFLGIASGNTGDVDLGALGTLGMVSFALYLLGGVLFGSALLRARVVPRWAAAMVVFGAGVTLLVPLLPHAVGRYAAVPMGVALIALGYAQWSGTRVGGTRSGR